MVDSPWPAAAKTYAALQRDDWRLRHEQPAVLGAGDRDRAARQVGQHGGAGQRGLGARRHRHPHVLADLDVEPRSGRSVAAKIRSGPNGTSCAGDADRRPRTVVAGGEVAALVELAVGRQVRLRRDAEDPAAVDHDRAVEHPGAVHAAGRPTTSTGSRSADAATIVGDRLLDRVEQGVLQQQVVDGVAGQRQLREDRDRDAVVVAGAGLPRARARRWRRGRRSATGIVQAATRANPWA